MAMQIAECGMENGDCKLKIYRSRKPMEEFGQKYCASWPCNIHNTQKYVYK